MTSHTRRFVVAPEEQRREEFAALFGSGDVRDELASIADLRDREDLLLSRYMKAVRLAVSSVNRDDGGSTAGVNPREGADEGAAVSV